MTDLDARVAELEQAVQEHDERDDERFKLFTEAVSGLRSDISKLGHIIDEALSGDNERAGLRERVRVLERTEQDRKWALRIIWTALIGEAVVIAFRIFNVKGLA